MWGAVYAANGARFKDMALAGGVAAEWDWRETDPATCHFPGITLAAVAARVTPATRHLILSRGFDGALHLTPALRAWLAAAPLTHPDLEVLHAGTADAAARLNDLLADPAVDPAAIVALIHSTC